MIDRRGSTFLFTMRKLCILEAKEMVKEEIKCRRGKN